MINLFALSGLSISVTALSLIVILLIYGRTKLHRVWMVFNISVFIWGSGCFLAGKAVSPQEALIGWKIAISGALFIAVLLCHTVYTLAGQNKKWSLIIMYLQAAFFAFFTLATNYIMTDASKWVKLFNSLYYNNANAFYYLMVICWTTVVVIGHIDLFKFIKISKGIRNVQAKYIFSAFLVGFIGGGLTLVPAFGIKLYPASNFGIALYVIIGTYAIIKYRIMDLSIVVTRAGIFIFVYALVLGFPFLFGYKTGLWVWATIFMAILATSGPFIYRILQGKAENLLLAEQRRYQKILIQAAEGMAKEHNIERLIKLIVYLVTKTVKVSFASIFLYEKEEGVYALRASRDHGRIPKDTVFSQNHPFVAFINSKTEPFLSEELPEEIKKMLDKNYNPGLIVPSTFDNKPLGFMMLGDKSNGKVYTADDINVFKILSQQSALAIENCIFMDEFKRTQERLFTAEKLAAIGGMADGVAHQMRNRLNTFSVVSGTQQFDIEDLLLDDKLDPAYKTKLEELLIGTKTIQENVKKTSAMINGILNFAKSDDKTRSMGEFSLSKVVETAIEVIKTKHQIADFSIKADYGEDKIYGVEVQIRECVYNMLDNAYEATMEKQEFYFKNESDKKQYTAEISLKLTQNETQYLIEIKDNGIGIKEENKHKVFSPFFTTKASAQSGTGIGMYVVKRMVEENHKGKIRFESQYGVGTDMFIELPKPEQNNA